MRTMPEKKVKKIKGTVHHKTEICIVCWSLEILAKEVSSFSRILLSSMVIGFPKTYIRKSCPCYS